MGCHEHSRQTAQHPGYDEGWGKGCGLGRPEPAVIRLKQPLLSGAGQVSGWRCRSTPSDAASGPVRSGAFAPTTMRGTGNIRFHSHDEAVSIASGATWTRPGFGGAHGTGSSVVVALALVCWQISPVPGRLAREDGLAYSRPSAIRGVACAFSGLSRCVAGWGSDFMSWLWPCC